MKILPRDLNDITYFGISALWFFVASTGHAVNSKIPYFVSTRSNKECNRSAQRN